MDLALELKLDDLVDVRKHGQAKVIGFEPDSSSQRCGRIQVEYLVDGSTFWCRPEKLRPLHPTSKRVLVAFQTEEYRLAVVHNVWPGHQALEIGCHEGLTTRIIANRATSVVGVDTARHAILLARQRYPDLRLEVLDGFNVQEVLALSPNGKYDRVMIDISGHAGLHLALPLVKLWLEAMPEATIIIKNRALFKVIEGREKGHVPAAAQGATASFRPAGNGPSSAAAMEDSTLEGSADDRPGHLNHGLTTSQNVAGWDFGVPECVDNKTDSLTYKVTTTNDKSDETHGTDLGTEVPGKSKNADLQVKDVGVRDGVSCSSSHRTTISVKGEGENSPLTAIHEDDDVEQQQQRWHGHEIGGRQQTALGSGVVHQHYRIKYEMDQDAIEWSAYETFQLRCKSYLKDSEVVTRRRQRRLDKVLVKQ
ncbi:hypothetical protein CEUSTIGMA_g6280.t1 [Chlamydomonas eustigma]|uniref:Methyltransferase domain-containing protein n=1 Tax=Chlamydomonas eustigma TaxID=1157962 RepID=A0A250X7H3_9CHLO|nr:hypothetical protein CEUSTIGMA_g6280.t1 [Chlamydomonas eustigma]|eukprot:GAX78842.1 hypothetical protein CEUSTIGMA_g6280.t1 [Chlamydomonas eustigma]